MSNNKHPVDDGLVGCDSSWFVVALFPWPFPFGGKKIVNKKKKYLHIYI
jgi:hypothetical protein